MCTLLKLAILLLLGYCSATEENCSAPNHIRCKNGDICIRIQYLCDGDNDCGDSSDEDGAFCQAWKNQDCVRNSAKCTRRGQSECILITHYCQLPHFPCEGSVDPKICQVLQNGKLQDFDTIVLNPVAASGPPSVHYETDSLTGAFLDRMDYTVRNSDCPILFTQVEDQCASIFNIGTLNWLESRTFCQSLGGDLLTIKKDLTNFYIMLQHLKDNHITDDFWIGGKYDENVTTWKWMDNRDIQVGSPVWAVKHTGTCSPREHTSIALTATLSANNGYCYHYIQAPTASEHQCTFMSYEHFFYVNNDHCLARKSFICIHNGRQSH